MDVIDMIKKYEGVLAEANNAELSRQEREMINSGGLKKYFLYGIELVKYDRGAVDLVYQMTIDSIDRELGDMVMREELTEENKDFIMDNL